jgi:outer membrane protein OmpA-like peptidoglycan-associated protein/tetratricopeptide (TPR) repeat protein
MTMARMLALLLPVFLMAETMLFGQEGRLSTQDKKAEKYFYLAVDSYQANNPEKALTEVDKAIQQDITFTEAYILKGDLLAELNRTSEAIASYEAAFRTNNPVSSGLYAVLAGAQLSIGEYAASAGNYRRFLESDRIPEQRRVQAVKGLKSAEFGAFHVAHPVPFEPENMGDSINTIYDEFINAVTADDASLYFTRHNPRNEQTANQRMAFEEDFYRSTMNDGVWLKAINLGPPVNSHGNEGALSLSPDGKYLFFAGCNREDGFGRCDIYWAKKEGAGWTVPENLGERVNSAAWESQPSFSADGKTLYFSSNRPGGRGASDIWMTELSDNGNWSIPVNLGDSINTPAEEMAPFIHPDDKTLYFSSRGHQGMGGADLFVSRKAQAGGWMKPTNLGYPINTHADEITLVVSAKGDLAYVSSDKYGGKGKQDVYRFPLYEEIRPLLTTYFKGIVFDSETKKKLSARFELIDISTALSVASATSDPVTGEFLLVLPTEREYALNVSTDGYLFYSDHFSLTGSNTKISPFIRNVALKPIRIGESVILKNIFFDTDQFTLKPESVAELDRLVTLLLKNPGLTIEISGHTDNVGGEQHNLTLSTNRANAVYQYLTGHGVPAARLSFKGYGLSKPVDTNATEQGRANNRRTEFKVTGS